MDRRRDHRPRSFAGAIACLLVGCLLLQVVAVDRCVPEGGGVSELAMCPFESGGFDEDGPAGTSSCPAADCRCCNRPSVAFSIVESVPFMRHVETDTAPAPNDRRGRLGDPPHVRPPIA